MFSSVDQAIPPSIDCTVELGLRDGDRIMPRAGPHISHPGGKARQGDDGSNSRRDQILKAHPQRLTRHDGEKGENERHEDDEGEKVFAHEGRSRDYQPERRCTPQAVGGGGLTEQLPAE